ncbi:hypothetical protein [Aeromicrobium marinum]|uniref:hypothetical protein n=1 Tax=Aeromicrobium marinum TaxID=219314 RepID=UPI0006812E36|nr:hypothetical protein [Aeromicrobium marinum]
MAVSVSLVLGGGSAAAVDLEPVGPREAAEQRTESHPRLVQAPEPPPRSQVPQDRYAMAGGCYTLQDPNGDWVVAADGGGYTVSPEAGDATGFHFQATELGRYLLFDPAEAFVSRSGGVEAADLPSPDAEWTVDLTDDGFVIGEPGAFLTVSGGSVGVGEATPFDLRLTDGCAPWDEIELNVDGPVFAGTSALQEVRGYLDDHIHHMAYGFLGGNIHCGRPWHPYGVKFALVDCDDHLTTQGQLALPEIVLSNKLSHDPIGWPTFADWPAWDSLTHEGTYFRWVERAWRGGQRLWVNLLVENSTLCAAYPGPNKTCTDLDSIRTQAQQTRDFANYVDAQSGGPGLGWYRVVTTPAEARAVINEGKLAVVLGTESSTLFGCRTILDSPASECTEEAVEAGLDELSELGVRQMVPTHKFDNAFSGVKGDEGTFGVVTNLGNFLHNGTFLDMRACADGAPADNAQLNPDALPEPSLAKLVGELFGVVGEVNPLPVALPLYGPAPHCNSRGLTDMGRFMLAEMVERNIIYDVDHMSAKGRSEALDEFEQLGYSGVISSHSWSDPEAIPRIFSLGGMVNSYAGDSTGFVDEWHGHVDDMDPDYYFGMGYGADTNGLGLQGAPRGAEAEDPVEYPFTALFGVEVDQQRSGERVYDVNVDGVAHYGLYPDWIEDLRRLAGDDIDADLVRGPEAYLQMWERAEGIGNDACRQPELRRQADSFDAITPGTSAQAVLEGFGQPHLRRDDTYRYCALDGDDDATVTVRFAGTEVASVVTGGDLVDGQDGPGQGDDRGDNAGRPGAVFGIDGRPIADGSAADIATDRTPDRATDPVPDAGGPPLALLLGGLVLFALGVAALVRRGRTGQA